MNLTPRSMFDMQTFHLGFSIFGTAISETEKATQAPDKLVSHCAVNAVFTAVQGLVDFQRPDGGTSAVSNISWIVGETGERKSTVDMCFFRAAHEFRAANEESGLAHLKYRARKKVWKIEENILSNRLKKLIQTQSPWRSHADKALMEHAVAETTKPKAVTFLFGDTSPMSLKLGLSEYPSACVHSTDAMSILEGNLFKEKGLLCELYGGESHYFDRLGKRIALHDKRLCVSAHSQPKRTFAFLRREGEDFRDAGLAARMTICLINNSMQGHRIYDAIEFPSPCRDRFNDRVRHLLEATKRAAKRKNFKRRKLTLSPEATRAYLEFANWIEQQMLPGGLYQDMRDYANRLAEKVGRLAAALHLFEGYRGEISHSTYMAARSFYDEATKDFQYLFNYLPSGQCLADLLLQWLRNYLTARGENSVRKAYILNHSHPNLRKKSALDQALALLEQQDHLYLQRDRGGKTWVHMGQRPGFQWAMMKAHPNGIGWQANLVLPTR